MKKNLLILLLASMFLAVSGSAGGMAEASYAAPAIPPAYDPGEPF